MSMYIFNKFIGAHEQKKIVLAATSILLVFLLLAIFLACLCLEKAVIGSDESETEILKSNKNMVYILATVNFYFNTFSEMNVKR